jgi:HSP20 family molecular chaperone IbpA
MHVSSGHNRRILIHRRHGIIERRGLCLHHHDVHAIFDELIHRPWGGVRWNPAVDIREDKDAFIIEMDLPGVTVENVRVVVEGATLSIEGQRQLDRCDDVTAHLCERPDGPFCRTFEFRTEVEHRNIESHWQDGVLTVIVPKTENELGSHS